MSEVKVSSAEFDRYVEAAYRRIAEGNYENQEQDQALLALAERKQQLAKRIDQILAHVKAEEEATNAALRRLLTPEEQYALIGMKARQR